MFLIIELVVIKNWTLRVIAEKLFVNHHLSQGLIWSL